MDYLFNNKSYPIVTSEAQVIEALKEDNATTRAVILRDDVAWQTENEIFGAGITMKDDARAAWDYVEDDPSGRFPRKIAGKVSYQDVVNVADVLREAGEANIIVDPQASRLFSDKANYLRAMYQRVHDACFGKENDETTVGHLMFTPKHGEGRSPMMHVDNVQLTLHVTFAGATLSLLNGFTSETQWKYMNSSGVMQAQEKENDRALTILTQQYSEEFSSAKLGDAIFMKGQRGFDLEDPLIRNTMAVHASSPYISSYGQAAAIFYSKKTLDIM
ncbi:MAG: hypothetical protein COA45_06415 [Zetaproteobacteria bacterium]|nr:MAG: hypothetical protein COA45_06415 [Zetaproteobacteria bacterium]